MSPTKNEIKSVLSWVGSQTSPKKKKSSRKNLEIARKKKLEKRLDNNLSI